MRVQAGKRSRSDFNYRRESQDITSAQNQKRPKKFLLDTAIQNGGFENSNESYVQLNLNRAVADERFKFYEFSEEETIQQRVKDRKRVNEKLKKMPNIRV